MMSKQQYLIVGGAILSTFLCLFVYWFVAIRAFYSPWGDEFALIVNSTRMYHPSLSRWFLKGFSEYFVVYPELPQTGRDFIRPVANLTFYLNSLVWNSRWSFYLISTYAFHAVTVGLVLYVGIKHFGLRSHFLAALGLLSALSAGFEFQSLYLPSFAFDILTAMLLLVCLTFLLDRRYLLAWLLLVLATFTRELAYFAPFAACVSVYFAESTRRRAARLSIAASFLLAFLPCWVIRQIAFRGNMRAYTLTRLSSPLQVLKVLLHGILKWPAMPLSIPEIGFRPALTPHQQASWFAYVVLSIGCLLSAYFWFLMLDYVTKFIRKASPASVGGSSESTAPLTVFIFLIGSLGLPVLGALDVRFGALAYPLLYLFLIHRISLPLQAPKVRNGVISILLFLGISQVYQKELMFFGDHRQQQELMWALSRSYIHQLANARAATVVTVDDLTGLGSSPPFVAEFAGYHGNLVRGSDLDVNMEGAQEAKILSRCSNEGTCHVDTAVPVCCGDLSWRGTDPTFMAQLNDTSRHDQDIEVRVRWADRNVFYQSWGSSSVIIRGNSFELLVPNLPVREYMTLSGGSSHP